MSARAATFLSRHFPATRPTHFLALRLGDPRLHERVRQLQAQVVAREPTLEPCAVPAERSHLTVLVFHAADDADVQRARDALRDCAPLAQRAFGQAPPALSFSGLGSFGQNVLFARVGPANADLEALSRFVEAVRQLYEHRELIPPSPGEGPAWVPHVTLLKTSRASSPKKRRRGGGAGRLRIRPESYEGLCADLGSHALPSLELCAMRGGGADSGYYPVLAELPLGQLPLGV